MASFPRQVGPARRRDAPRAGLPAAHGRVGAIGSGSGVATPRLVHEAVHQARDEDIQKVLRGRNETTLVLAPLPPLLGATVATLAAAPPIASAVAPLEGAPQGVGGEDAPRNGPTPVAAPAVAGAVVPVPASGLTALPGRRETRTAAGAVVRAGRAAPEAAPTDAVEGPGRVITTALAETTLDTAIGRPVTRHAPVGVPATGVRPET